jgi:cell division transport system permease protein
MTGILLRSSWQGLRGAGLTGWIAVATIATALFMLGAFALVVVNMEGLLDEFGRELQVTAYLADGLSEAEAEELASRVETIEGVESVVRVGKAEALERFRAMAGGAALLEGVEGNPLPASLGIFLEQRRRTPEGLAILQGSLDGLPGIDEVAHGQEWVDGYARLAALLRVVGYALGGVLSLATLLIVANTIRLALYARQDEVDILELVGASRLFVRTPFLVEGFVQGALGGAIAALLLALAFSLLVPELRYGLAFFLGNAAPRFFDAGELFQMGAGGAGLGLAGAALALGGRRT